MALCFLCLIVWVLGALLVWALYRVAALADKRVEERLMAKEYPCPRSETKMCNYGGNKNFNYGFMVGIASYCRKVKRWVSDLDKCPLESANKEKEQ